MLLILANLEKYNNSRWII